MYRTIIEVVVLHDEPLGTDVTLAQIAHEIKAGDWSGFWDIKSTSRRTKRQMARDLVEQGSAPEFLLGEHGWVYELHSGDEVKIQDGDEVRTVTIGRIQFFEETDGALKQSGDGDIVRIETTDGELVERFVSEL